MAAGDSLRYRALTAVPADRPETYGSRTLTIHPEELVEETAPVSSGEGDSSKQPVGTLKLRGGGGQSGNRKVKWDDAVVDNEGLGRKKSKICCIYHKPRIFGESSDDGSSSSSSSISDSDDSDHDHKNGHNHHHHHNHKRSDKHYKNSPNAYERQPQYKSNKSTLSPSPKSEDNPTPPS
ncbi:phosphatase inhibitor-domain-containing protein [Glomus cerebriforme]|uniref:Type 1 phosphatases regulator n=1 Tax=Glomus cerebriforme TaxID=658196 RepID=A0A397T8B6_9GLOM|nr:phosphatase inhibitor-domain-containing protein [Glomus cerebriforme]